VVVQVSDKFSTGIEVLFNYLVICFESLYCVLQAIPAWGGVLEYVFYIFRLLVPSKLDSYDVYAPTWGGVLEELLVFGFWVIRVSRVV
jgi:hypothetical protein